MDQVLCPKIGKCAGTAIPYTTGIQSEFVIFLVAVRHTSTREEVTRTISIGYSDDTRV